MLNSILLLMDQSAAARARLDLAVGLARKHGAAIVATFLPPGLQGSPGPAAAPLADQFRELTSAAGIAAEWLDLAGAADVLWRDLLHHTHCTGLVVVGQAGEEGEGDLPADLPERLLVASGRPVLTVPYAGRFTTCGERVLVAWSDGRESTRALHDSLPLLMQAQRVHLVKLITDEARMDGSTERLAMLVDHLRRYGIRAKGDILLSLDFPPGDMLLNRACEEGCDLLVMGGVREAGGWPTLGKIARHVLQHLTVPVLMAH